MQADEALNEFISMVIGAIKDYKYEGTIDGWDYDWAYENVLLFTITIMSTIG